MHGEKKVMVHGSREKMVFCDSLDLMAAFMRVCRVTANTETTTYLLPRGGTAAIPS